MALLTDWQPKQQKLRSASSSLAWKSASGGMGRPQWKQPPAAVWLRCVMRAASQLRGRSDHEFVGIYPEPVFAALHANMQLPIALERKGDVSLIAAGCH